MATYDTDEEQIEAIKRWWKENGNSLLISAAVVVLGIFSWRQWESSRQAGAEQASQLYQQIVTIGAANPGQEVGEQAFSTAMFVTGELRSEFADTIYSRYAALFMAKLYVEAGDLDSAEAELSWILDNPSLGFLRDNDEALLLEARLRLARVLLAQDAPQRALDLLGAVDAGAFAGGYAEVEGDAYMALGQEENALEAYHRAVAAGANSVLVELKLRDLGSS